MTVASILHVVRIGRDQWIMTRKFMKYKSEIRRVIEAVKS